MKRSRSKKSSRVGKQRKGKSVVRVAVVKRRGHREAFNERKVYDVVLRACKSAHLPHDEAVAIAFAVGQDVKKWAEKKKVVDSHEIAKKVTEFLAKEERDAAFLFETHLDLS